MSCLKSASRPVMYVLFAFLVVIACTMSVCDSCFATNEFEKKYQLWISNVTSYNYRFIAIEAGQVEQVRYFEAAGDKQDHTLLIELDGAGREIRRTISNPDYTAIIKRSDADTWILERVEVDDFRDHGESRWLIKRAGVDPFFLSTILFFSMRSHNISGLEKVLESESSIVWRLSEAGPRETKNPPGFPDNGNSYVSEVRLANENNELRTVSVVSKKSGDEGTVISVERIAEFRNWTSAPIEAIPLQVKFMNESKTTFLEYRIEDSQTVKLNSLFDSSNCYLRAYGLPDPNQTVQHQPGLVKWWYLWVLFGMAMILLPLYLSRRKN